MVSTLKPYLDLKIPSTQGEEEEEEMDEQESVPATSKDYN